MKIPQISEYGNDYERYISDFMKVEESDLPELPHFGFTGHEDLLFDQYCELDREQKERFRDAVVSNCLFFVNETEDPDRLKFWSLFELLEDIMED